MINNIKNLESELAESTRRLSNLTRGLPNSSYFSRSTAEPQSTGNKFLRFIGTTIGLGIVSLICIGIYANSQNEKVREKAMREWERQEMIENNKTLYILDARPRVDWVEYSTSSTIINELRTFYPEFQGVNTEDIKVYSIKKQELNFRRNDYDNNPVVYWADNKQDGKPDYYITKRKFKEAFYNMFGSEEYKRGWGYKEHIPNGAISLDDRFER